ncbi:hypothetical protein BDF19DRAFT_433325 [Syncephalis fuscata]|nr:hypothetical protein BDF19DRAFT_433325 [Syncephalis fuscata]
MVKVITSPVYKSRLLSHVDVVLMHLVQFLDDHTLLLLTSTSRYLYGLITTQRSIWAHRYQRAFSLGSHFTRSTAVPRKIRSVDERELSWLRWWWRYQETEQALLSTLNHEPQQMPTRHAKRMSLNWHRAYTARLLVEFNLRNGTISIPTLALSLPLQNNSNDNASIKDNKNEQSIIRHPQCQKFALIRHTTTPSKSSRENSMHRDVCPSMHVTLVDWCGLDPARTWCKITESYLLAAESFQARQLQVWPIRPPRLMGLSSGNARMADVPGVPFLVNVPGQIGDRFGISISGDWCLIYIRPQTDQPPNDEAERTGGGGGGMLNHPSGSCIGREGQAHMQIIHNRCVYVYVCHVEGLSSSLVNLNNLNGTDETNSNSDTATPATSNRQVIRWRVWELGIYTAAPRCVAQGRVFQHGRPSRWIHACRVDDYRVILYTGRDFGVEDMLVMHTIQASPSKANNVCDLDSTPMLSVGYLCVHDRSNCIHLLSLNDGVFLRSLAFDGQRPAGQLLGLTYLMNMSNLPSENESTPRNRNRRSTRSRRRPRADSVKQTFEKGASQILDLRRGTPVSSIASMLTMTNDETGDADSQASRAQNWEVCCSYALRINSVRTTKETNTTGSAASTNVDLEWIEFTNL